MDIIKYYKIILLINTLSLGKSVLRTFSHVLSSLFDYSIKQISSHHEPYARCPNKQRCHHQPPCWSFQWKTWCHLKCESSERASAKPWSKYDNFLQVNEWVKIGMFSFPILILVQPCCANSHPPGEQRMPVQFMLKRVLSKCWFHLGCFSALPSKCLYKMGIIIIIVFSL